MRHALQKLIDAAEKNGFVTYSQINDALSPAGFESQEIENFLLCWTRKVFRSLRTAMTETVPFGIMPELRYQLHS